MNKPMVPQALDPSAVLADPTAPLAQVMGAVEALEAKGGLTATAHVGISAGSTVELLGLFLRRHALLAGVKRHKSGVMTTESVVMRASSGTVRWVKGEHRKDV